MKRFFASIALFAISTTASAQGLSQYSAAELLGEVGRRIDNLTGGGGGGSGNQLTVGCENHETLLQVITRSNIGTRKFYNPSNSSCESQLAKLRTKFPSTFSNFTVVQVCDNHEMVTLRITDNAEITEVSRAYNTSYNTCVGRL